MIEHIPDPAGLSPSGPTGGVKNARGPRLSAILTGLVCDASRERIAISDLFVATGERAFGALLFLFALPNLLPMPPGTSSILGVPLIFLAAQMSFGFKPWLPSIIARRSLRRSDLSAVVERSAPWIARAERILAPRLGFLVHPPAERVVGLLCLALAIILILPIPLGNFLPALAICIFAFGILERDGLWIIAGTAMVAISVGVVWGIVVALVEYGLVLARDLWGWIGAFADSLR
ncbi:exopolysaccharide biosynthesis protein [Jiella pacifica]|uniref:exopolysaccharide biosynthesis protein n=1 Tax=Jiella pacifica TaxID=2696469 RepID=UPI0028A690EF|nr:exopolysaccharide biosynthesis protein [Jiella pacifica]